MLRSSERRALSIKGLAIGAGECNGQRIAPRGYFAIDVFYLPSGFVIGLVFERKW